jgi:1-acyl-sn-glycerol-3-phosphate acyltransferase
MSKRIVRPQIDPTPIVEMLAPESLEGPPALGRDPFEAPAGPDPLRERLDLLERRVTQVPRPASPPRARRTQRPADTPRISRRPRHASVPPLSEVELPPPSGVVDRLLTDDTRRVLTALTHLVDGESALDPFGFSPATTKSAFPLFHALYRGYFRVKSEGHEHLPKEGGAILACNHAGLLPFDAAMSIVDVALHTDPPRLARAVVDRWAGALPFVNVLYSRLGQIVGTRENFAELLDEGQLVLVFPEGMNGVRKTITQRYRLQTFRVGFIEQALRAGVPIVPMAVIGSDDQTPILYDVKPLAKWLGLPVAPITPTFPLLGPLGLLPYPVSYRIVYGEPLDFSERFGPEGAQDARLVRYLANQVRGQVRRLIDRHR